MDTFSNILFHAHSGLRYVVLLAGLLALSSSLTAALRGQGCNRPGRAFLATFVGVMDLQVLMGLVLVFVRVFYPALWGHLAMMILAAVSAHVALAINKRRPSERQSHWVAVAGSAVALALLVGGILSIGRSVL